MIKKQIHVWEEMGLTREQAESIQAEFDKDKKNTITYDALIHKYGLKGRNAFRAYLLGLNVSSQGYAEALKMIKQDYLGGQE